MRRILPTVQLASCASAFLFCAVAASSGQTVQQTVDKIKKQSASDSLAALSSESNPGVPQIFPTPVECPVPTALDLFRHVIAFERTEENGTLNGLGTIHADVWERGSSTAFYIRESLPQFTSGNFRMVYLFGKDGLGDGGGCPAEQNWLACVEKFAGAGDPGKLVRTCTTTIDTHVIPAWAPSPNDLLKHRLAEQLRSEIESHWHGVQEIVIRDFNLNDPQITMYLKMPDGEYFQGCALHSLREPHCDGWHLFGQAPLSAIRRQIFEQPYRLK